MYNPHPTRDRQAEKVKAKQKPLGKLKQTFFWHHSCHSATQSVTQSAVIRTHKCCAVSSPQLTSKATNVCHTLPEWVKDWKTVLNRRVVSVTSRRLTLSLRRPRAFYSTSFSAAGEVCEWAAALSSSSVCSGVSRSQEVIEFPLLKIAIIALAGNLPEMKWTAGVYVCVNGGSRKGGRARRVQL